MRRDAHTAKEDIVVKRLKYDDSVNMVNVLKPDTVTAQGQGT